MACAPQVTVGFAARVSEVEKVEVMISPDFAFVVSALFDEVVPAVNTGAVLSTVKVAFVGVATTRFPDTSFPTESEQVAVARLPQEY